MASDTGTFSCEKAFGDYTRASKPRDITFLPAGETIHLDAHQIVHILNKKYTSENKGNWTAYHCLSPSTLTGPLLYSAKDAPKSKLSFKEQYLSIVHTLDFIIGGFTVLTTLVSTILYLLYGNEMIMSFLFLMFPLCAYFVIFALIPIFSIKMDKTYVAEKEIFSVPGKSIFSLNIDTTSLRQYTLPPQYRHISHQQ